jgi:tRNA modification GTPase
MNDIIAAISTPNGVGGVSIIRVSGNDVFEIINRYIKKIDTNKQEKNSIIYAHFVDLEGVFVDEILISFFKNPHSFTGENTVEINCHGGIFNTNLILKTLLKEDDIRLAEPGEFSKRAFLNGKKSLSEAESLMEMINATNENAHKMATKAMTGETQKLIQKMRNDLMDIVSLIEVGIDYPEYDDIENITNDKLRTESELLASQINQIIIDSKKGVLIREGIKTAIIGVPNVGKSSLLNMLSRENRAIVTEIAGTTRDTIESKINLGSIVLDLVDTAGIRETSDIVEIIGVEKSLELIDEAELVLFVTDGMRDLTSMELEILNKLSSKNFVFIINKLDDDQVISRGYENEVHMSALNKKGAESLESEIIRIFELCNFDVNNSGYVNTTKQVSQLEKIRDLIDGVIENNNLGMPVDLIEIDLKEAMFILGEMLGIEVKNDLLDELFGRFCLGK